MYDVIIIGGGVIGLSIARELASKQLKIAVLEKNSDIGEGASKANSGIVHAGFDASFGTLKARLNLRGSTLMPKLAKELDFEYLNNGAMVLCFSENEKPKLEELLARGLKNGVTGLEILSQAEVNKKEPSINENVKYALYAPSGAIVCPFNLAIAMAENARANGVEFFREKKVIIIKKNNTCYFILADDGTSFEAKVIVNCAGIFADEIHRLVSSIPLTLAPRKGEYLLFDKTVGNTVKHTLFQLPTEYGKGVLITPTVHGNLLIGPTALDIEDKAGVDTTGDGLETVLKKAAESIKEIPRREIITSFAGLRANSGQGDFIIAEVSDSPGFIDVAGIDSPGLTSAPAIGEYVKALIADILPALDNPHFVSKREGIKPGNNEVICRCETITKAEILAAIQRTNELFKNPGQISLDSIKRRVRPGMGRCQAGFCTPRVAELIAGELGINETDITKSGRGSEILMGLIS
ncbi:MAG: NAD(P)/FAD-dependent oxidoreductase [Lachnospiraceae bacterium]|nr:NAD(P)/FAD-dependent oxidoreductase [Lachnospiraceae bacterium]